MMQILPSRLRHYRTRTLALMVIQSIMLSTPWPMAAYADMDDALQNVPLPALDGEFQNTDGSTYAQNRPNSNSNAGDVAPSTVNGQRPPITQPMLLLAPHCIEQDRAKCERFTVVDPLTVTTRAYALGDVIDVDVILETPNPAQVASVRAWLQYDPTALEARSIELLPVLGQPIPGEQEIDKSRGIVKIGGGAAPGSIRTQETPIARVTFRLLSAQQNTMILFSNYKADGKGETTILDGSGNPLLAAQPSVTRVMANAGGSIGQASSPPYTQPPVTTPLPNPTQSSVPTTPPAGTPSAFDILQVQGVRVTSQDDSLYIGWAALQTRELAGYNVYYGTVSGRYIQRRALTAGETSLVIRGLENGVQYFVAIRGFTSAGVETAFSQEASVVIGRPETSTAPLTPGETTPIDKNPIDTRGGSKVIGETGINETVAVLLIAAAFAGTYLAWRRQLTLASLHTHNE